MARIEYEFFYQPGKSLAHPRTPDWLCLLLNPTSVDVHWITDGRHDPHRLAGQHHKRAPESKTQRQSSIPTERLELARVDGSRQHY